MRRGISRNSVAVIASLLVLLAAGGRTLAGSGSDTNDGVSGVIHRFKPVEERVIPSRTGEYRLINADERSLEIIIGSDDRQQVTNTTSFPNSAVTYIEAFNDDEDIAYLCTAAFVGPNVLLTAAHCLWIPELGGFPDGLAVVPGLNGDNAPFGFDFASEIWVPDGWINADGNINQGYPVDYGLVVLENDELSSQVGEFTVNVLSTSDLESAGFQPSTAGYPGDKPRGTQWSGSSGSFVSVDSDLLVHDIDSFQGQSGSPVWRASDMAVVGVLSFETFQHNYARRITRDVMTALNGACATLGCDIRQAGTGDPDPTPTGEPSPTVTATPTSTATEEPPPAATSVPPTEPSTDPPLQGDVGAFDRTWQWTDDPVLNGIANRTWMWGPAFTGIMAEPYDAALPGGGSAPGDLSREITDGDHRSGWRSELDLVRDERADRQGAGYRRDAARR